MTPMQSQYLKIKEEYKDYILMFRLGDFYEVFHDDAILVSKVLGITLTGRGKGEERYPMAGIPYHALPSYLPKLSKAGLKVAIADQMEEPVQGRLVERQITKIITPGTIVDENSLDSSKNNYLASVFIENSDKTRYFLTFCDLTTGELKAFNTDNAFVLKNEINKVNPAEILCAGNQKASFESIIQKKFEVVDESEYEFNAMYRVLIDQFKVQNLKGYGIEDEKSIILATGVLIKYLLKNQKTDIKHITGIKTYEYSNIMQLDVETIRNLELFYSMADNSEKNSVYWVLNQCQNSMGKRKLRNFILHPLTNKEILQERYDSVEYFFNENIITSEIREFINGIADIERVLGRVGIGTANPKDINALKISIDKILELIKSLNLSEKPLPNRIVYLIKSVSIDRLAEASNLIQECLNEDPPTMINEGGIFKDGYDSKIDELRNIKRNAKSILEDIQKREIESTSIPSLKISFNKVFGYYIEVTNTHLSKVPASYIRKQTLTNAERYITQELKELEEKILNSEDLLIKLELDMYKELLQKVASFIPELLTAGDVIAEIDVLSNFGYIARQYQYCKPEILTEESQMNIKDGRHIVVERLAGKFIPNDTVFESDSIIHILTGPNMSGKSTYIRQVALLALIAQIGSFVPAEQMKFSIVDRIFTRVGASDNLAKGESTFMVEMTEAANILNNATEKSLVILDEIGRGTSTYDGVAIAWSIVEFLEKQIKCKTLFATHYHELIALEHKDNIIKNFNVSVIEDKGDIIFQYKISTGGTDRSYGVHVAKLAGVPQEVIVRANEILEKFENGTTPKVKDSKEQPPQNTPKKPKQIHPEQLGLMN